MPPTGATHGDVQAYSKPLKDLGIILGILSSSQHIKIQVFVFQIRMNTKKSSRTSLTPHTTYKPVLELCFRLRQIVNKYLLTLSTIFEANFILHNHQKNTECVIYTSYLNIIRTHLFLGPYAPITIPFFNKPLYDSITNFNPYYFCKSKTLKTPIHLYKPQKTFICLYIVFVLPLAQKFFTLVYLLRQVQTLLEESLPLTSLGIKLISSTP